VQAKRYAQATKVAAEDIRDFGSLDRFKASQGLFILTSVFLLRSKRKLQNF
jgi:restriction endonuclease Mrr